MAHLRRLATLPDGRSKEDTITSMEDHGRSADHRNRGRFCPIQWGNKKSFDSNKTLLDVMGAANYVGEDAGLASLLDLAMNGAMYGMLGGAMHAISVVATEGITAQDFSSELLIPYLSAITGIIPNLARQFDTKEFSVGVSAKLAMQQVGFRNIRKASEDQGISSELLDPIQS